MQVKHRFSRIVGKDFLKWENGGERYSHCMGKSVNISITVGYFIVENFVQRGRDLLLKACFSPFGKAGKGAVPLRNRGNLTFWLSSSVIKSWKATRSGKPGRQQKYSPFTSHFDLTDSVGPQKTFLQPREDSSRQLLHKRFGHGQGIVSL